MATTTTSDFPARMTSKPPVPAYAPLDRKRGVSLDLAEEARRREHDADCDAYHAWQGRYSNWLSDPNVPCPTAAVAAGDR